MSSGTMMTKEKRYPISYPETEHYCFGANEFFVISFFLPEKKKNNLSLNIANGSDEFRKIKNNGESFEWTTSNSLICFAIGSWTPSGDENLELYFKFFKGANWINDEAVLYLKILFDGKKVTSSLMLSKRNILINEDELKQKLFEGLTDKFYRLKSTTISILSAVHLMFMISC